MFQNLLLSTAPLFSLFQIDSFLLEDREEEEEEEDEESLSEAEVAHVRCENERVRFPFCLFDCDGGLGGGAGRGGAGRQAGGVAQPTSPTNTWKSLTRHNTSSSARCVLVGKLEVQQQTCSIDKQWGRKISALLNLLKISAKKLNFVTKKFFFGGGTLLNPWSTVL